MGNILAFGLFIIIIILIVILVRGFRGFTMRGCNCKDCRKRRREEK